MKHMICLCWLCWSVMQTHLPAQCLSQPVPPSTWQWWAEPEFEVYLADQSPSHQFIESPFYPNPSQNTNFLVKDPNDDNPADGWELLFKKFGTELNPIEVPSYALYNRYTGKIRVFAYRFQGADGVWGTGFNKIEFIGGQETALFSHLVSPTSALDNFPKGLSSTTVNRIYYGNSNWYFYEFTAAYDPCSCQSDAGLNLISNLSDIDYLYLKITGTSFSEPIIDNNIPTGPNTLQEDFATLNNGLEAGQKLYKSATQFKKGVEKVISWSKPAANVPQAPGSGEKSPLKNITPWLNAIPYAGYAIGLLTTLFGGGQSGDAVKPVSYSTSYNLDASGSIHEDADYALQIINIPGGADGGNLPVHYDNVLGVMNVLRTPIILSAFKGENQLSDDCNGYATKEMTYKLKSPLQYVINEAAGLGLTPKEIKASIYFKYCVFTDDENVEDSGVIPMLNDRGRTPYMPLDCLDDYVVKTGYQVNLINCVDHILPLYSMVEGVPEYVHLIAVFAKPGAGDDEDILIASGYEYDLEAAPYTFDDTPANPYEDFDENITLNNLGQISSQGQQFYAWNEITVNLDMFPANINMIRLFAPYITLDPGWYNSGFIGVGTDQFGPYRQYRKSRHENQVLYIRHYFAYEPCPLAPPQTPAEINQFCNSTYKQQFFLQHTPEDRASLVRAETPAVSLYPNPAGNRFYLNFNSKEESKIKVDLYDTVGRLIQNLQPETVVNAGNTRLQCDVPEIPTGSYFVKCLVNGHLVTLNLVKI